VKLELPEKAISNHTSFRFIQPYFGASSDSWALDNVRVFRNFPENWNKNEVYLRNVGKTKKLTSLASCCFDSERCERRLSENEWKQCRSIQGFQLGQYVLRGPELFILMVVAINVFKFIYVSTMYWYMKKILPFSEEFRALAKMDYIMKYIPARYRPKRDIANLVNDIHLSARLVGSLRDDIADKEDAVDEEAMRLKEAEKKERKKRKREKFKRKKKLGYSDEEAKYDSSDDDEEELERQKSLEKEVVITDDLEKLKRQNVAMLRIPFEIKVDHKWKQLFSCISVGMFSIMFLAMASLVKPYEVSQSVTSFGSIKSTFTVTSFGVGFLAFLCEYC
jgi:hypothetical protein